MRIPYFFFSASLAVLVSGCGLSVEESCKIICETGAECKTSSTATSSCEQLCQDQANKSESYAEAIEKQAECYDKQSDYYDDQSGVCLAIRGGACDISL